MVSVDGKYYSRLPSGEVQGWQNFPVVGLTDVEATTDVLNLLGQAGRSSNIAWRKVTTDSDKWNDPLICIGGSFKIDRVLELCEPSFLTYRAPDSFAIPGGQIYTLDSQFDYALIARLYHPQTGVSCLVLFGFGMAGTAAAGSYWRHHAARLARIYGQRPFAMILRVGWHDGPASAQTVWMSKNIGMLARVLHPFTWWKHRKLLVKSVA